MSDITYLYDDDNDCIIVNTPFPGFYTETMAREFNAEWYPEPNLDGHGLWILDTAYWLPLEQWVRQLRDSESKLERIEACNARSRENQALYHREQSDDDMSSDSSEECTYFDQERNYGEISSSESE